MSSIVLDNTSKVLIKNLENMYGNSIVLAGLPKDDLVDALVQYDNQIRVEAFTQNYNHFIALKNKHIPIYFSKLYNNSEKKFDNIVVFLQKSKLLNQFWIQGLLPFLKHSGKLFLIGENSAGIKSWRFKLKNYFSCVRKLDSAKHCVLYEAKDRIVIDDFNEQNFMSDFDVFFQEKKIKIQSYPGVFSYGKLDIGTQVLLETLNNFPKGDILDYGCGTGVITACMASCDPYNNYCMLDIDALALDCARINLSNAKNIKIIKGDSLYYINSKFNFIVSNPPFHQGIKTNYQCAELFLSQAKQYLKPGGELRIVANSFLNYQTILKKEFRYCNTLLKRKGFSIYQVKKDCN